MSQNYVDRIEELKRYFPKPFYNLKQGQGLSILLEAFGEELNHATEQVEEARDQLLLATATKRYLDQHGVNVDVFKPRGYKMSDKSYRELIKIVTNSSKNIERVFERILPVYFGEHAIERGLANVYSVRPNEVIVELKTNALIIASSRDLYGTSYLHGSNSSDGKDQYPSSYVYDSETRTDLVGSYVAGETEVQIGAFKPERLPLTGTIYIGSPTNFNFEAKGFARASLSSTSLTLMGPLAFPHSSGDSVVTPNFVRRMKSQLTAPIAEGESLSEIHVANAADFPLERGAIKLAGSFANEEIVPFTARKLSDNTRLLIDPDYIFRFNHHAGEKVQLLARQSRPSIDGLNWPFYVNDTDALRDQFFNLMRRLKATGVRIVFELL